MKIYVDTRALNNAILRDIQQILEIDHLIHQVAEQLHKGEREAWFTSVDFHFAYSEVEFDLKTAE